MKVLFLKIESWQMFLLFFKNGTKDNAGNYRPVSLTAQACKLFESYFKR